MTAEEKLHYRLQEEARLAAEARACTGVRGIHEMARDIKIDNFSVTFYGAEILQDTKLELSCGNRYGLMGVNGCGKSCLLAVLGNREVPIQEHIDIFYLDREVPASEKTALEAVMEADEERIRLEKLAEELVTREDDESQDYLMQIYDRLDELGSDTAEARNLQKSWSLVKMMKVRITLCRFMIDWMNLVPIQLKLEPRIFLVVFSLHMKCRIRNVRTSL